MEDTTRVDGVEQFHNFATKNNIISSRIKETSYEQSKKKLLNKLIKNSEFGWILSVNNFYAKTKKCINHSNRARWPTITIASTVHRQPLAAVSFSSKT